MKTYRENSYVSTRNYRLEKMHKRENSILTNKSNLLDISLNSSKYSECYHRKLNSVKLNIEKKYQVIIFNFRTMKKIEKIYNIGFWIDVN